jgi:hypothetical protein
LVLLDLLDTAVDLERVGARGAKDGAAPGQDAAALGDAQLHGQPLEGAPPPVAEPDELEAVVADATTYDGADDRVEAGAVATAGEDSDTHVSS